MRSVGFPWFLDQVLLSRPAPLPVRTLIVLTGFTCVSLSLVYLNPSVWCGGAKLAGTTVVMWLTWGAFGLSSSGLGPDSGCRLCGLLEQTQINAVLQTDLHVSLRDVKPLTKYKESK